MEAGETLDDDEILSDLRPNDSWRLSTDFRLCRGMRDASELMRVILLYLVKEQCISIDTSLWLCDKYLFLADNPVRPGKYVFTIFVQTFPCSATARRSNISWRSS